LSLSLLPIFHFFIVTIYCISAYPVNICIYSEPGSARIVSGILPAESILHRQRKNQP
jgi:hypothetical protein